MTAERRPANPTPSPSRGRAGRRRSTTSFSKLSNYDIVNAGALTVSSCCCSTTDSPRTWPSYETVDRGNQVTSLHVMPDFVQVYSFLGSVFDPNTSGHLQKLKATDPIDVETVLILMRNLSFNLTCPEFEAHITLLSSSTKDRSQVKKHQEHVSCARRGAHSTHGFKVNKNAAHYSLSMHACGIQNTHLVGQNFIIGSNYDNNKVHLFGFRVYLERERESA